MQNNAAEWFVDRHGRQGRSENIAFREAFGQQRSISYQRLSESSARVAGALARAQIHREERVACLILDQIEYPEIFWGALKAGVIPVAINTLLSADVYERILTDSRASCLVVSEALWEIVKPAAQNCACLRKIIFIGSDTPQGLLNYTDFLRGAEKLPAIEVSSDECAFWLYSSGSTGQPKGVRHVHGALRATADTYGAQVLGIHENDIVYSVAKIFFAYGLGNAMTFPMSVGATTILYNGRPTPEVVAGIIKAQQPTIFCGVPTLYAAALAYLEQHGVPDNKLRLCISAGEALPEDIGQRWRSLVGVDILDGVGSTEMLHIFLSNAPGDVQYGTSGVAVPGYAVKCVDEHGGQIQPGGVGELLVKGDSAADGYWNQRQKTRQTFEGEWTRTGDKYEITAAGRYLYCGRTDDMFKVSGIWVSPFEVEQALVSHRAVLEAAVVAEKDNEGLEKPKAFIVLQEGASTDGLGAELKASVKDKIGKWKYPRWIEFVTELPKTATGKIQRFKLRSPASQ